MEDIQGKLQLCESRIGYKFKDKKLLCEALQTSGNGFVNWNGKAVPIPKNDRLAVLGDSALDMALCRLWYPTELSKGRWDNIRNGASNPGLANKGSAHGLDECVILNPGTATVSLKSMATTVEAILGAVEIDGGSDTLLRVATGLGLIPESLVPVMSNATPYHSP